MEKSPLLVMCYKILNLCQAGIAITVILYIYTRSSCLNLPAYLSNTVERGLIFYINVHYVLDFFMQVHKKEISFRIHSLCHSSAVAKSRNSHPWCTPNNVSNRSVTAWLPRQILLEKGAHRGD